MNPTYRDITQWLHETLSFFSFQDNEGIISVFYVFWWIQHCNFPLGTKKGHWVFVNLKQAEEIFVKIALSRDRCCMEIDMLAHQIRKLLPEPYCQYTVPPVPVYRQTPDILCLQNWESLWSYTQPIIHSAIVTTDELPQPYQIGQELQKVLKKHSGFMNRDMYVYIHWRMFSDVYEHRSNKTKKQEEYRAIKEQVSDAALRVISNYKETTKKLGNNGTIALIQRHEISKCIWFFRNQYRSFFPEVGVNVFDALLSTIYEHEQILLKAVTRT